MQWIHIMFTANPTSPTPLPFPPSLPLSSKVRVFPTTSERALVALLGELHSGHDRSDGRGDGGDEKNSGGDGLFDLVYIDGSHSAKDVLLDSLLAWRLLRPGGAMIWDDYEWALPWVDAEYVEETRARDKE